MGNAAQAALLSTAITGSMHVFGTALVVIFVDWWVLGI